MQIRPTSVRLVRLKVSLSLYLDRTFRLRLSLSRNFSLRPKFQLRESLSEITSLFNLSLVLDQTLAQRKAQQKAKSKSEVRQCLQHQHSQLLLNDLFYYSNLHLLNWPIFLAGCPKLCKLLW